MSCPAGLPGAPSSRLVRKRSAQRHRGWTGDWDEVAARSDHQPRRRDSFGPGPDQPREPTARATSSSDTKSAAVAWMAMSTFARLVSGIVSVGLKALELVTDR